MSAPSVSASQTDVSLDNLCQQPPFVGGEEQRSGVGRITRGMGRALCGSLPVSAAARSLPAALSVWAHGSIYGLLYREVKNFEKSNFISFVV